MDNVNGGVDVPLLRARLAADSSDVLLVYVVPSNHNPTAATYSAERRRELAEACVEFGVHLVADEVYHLLSWEGEEGDGLDDGTPPLSTSAAKKRPPRMATLNNYEDQTPSSFIISISSFTKVLCPGLRFGWIESHPSLISHLSQNGYINSQGGCCPLIGEVARRLILNGSVERNIQLLSHSYSSNVSAALDELSKCVPPSLLSVPFKPRGGYFLWVRVGDGVEDAEALVDSLLTDKNVAVLKGKACDPIAGGNNIGIDLSRYFRICFAFLEGEQVREGVRRIVEHANERAKANAK
jgi:2-aminoadipate transaminase